MLLPALRARQGCRMFERVPDARVELVQSLGGETFNLPPPTHDLLHDHDLGVPPRRRLAGSYCAWAETNVYQPAWAASLSSFFVRSLSRLSCPGSNRSSSIPSPSAAMVAVAVGPPGSSSARHLAEGLAPPEHPQGLPRDALDDGGRVTAAAYGGRLP